MITLDTLYGALLQFNVLPLTNEPASVGENIHSPDRPPGLQGLASNHPRLPHRTCSRR
jgi:hypothetical protein